MKWDSVINILFSNYAVDGGQNKQLDTEREKAFAALDKLIEGNTEAEEALITFQYEALKAAYYEGFTAAADILTGK